MAGRPVRTTTILVDHTFGVPLDGVRFRAASTFHMALTWENASSLVTCREARTSEKVFRMYDGQVLRVKDSKGYSSVKAVSGRRAYGSRG